MTTLLGDDSRKRQRRPHRETRRVYIRNDTDGDIFFCIDSTARDVRLPSASKLDAFSGDAASSSTLDHS